MRATENFAYGTEQGESWVYGGTVLDEDDPIVRAFPGMFEPVYETVSNPSPAKRARHG